jgi:PAS domain S-box-containing protein
MPSRRKVLTPEGVEEEKAPDASGEEQDQYRNVFDRFPKPTWILDRATLKFLDVNRAAIAYFGYTRDQFRSMDLLALQVPEDALEVRQKLGQRAAPAGRAGWRMKNSKGEVFRSEVAWRPVGFDRVPAILMMSEPAPRPLRRLLIEAEESRTRLEILSRRLVSIQESERSEISRELHDEVGQLLTGLKLLVSADRGGAAANGGAATELREKVTGIVNELMTRVRDISMNLRPPMLDQMGLVPTLEWYFERYTERTGVRVQFQEEIGRDRYSSGLEITAFRIIQEALTNAARHAGVEQVSVEIRSDPEGLWLLIEDKGKGFDPQEALAQRSAGIAGMQERARLVGGHLILESAIASGTRIAVVLPPSRPQDPGEERRESIP